MTDICSDCVVIVEQNLHLSFVPTGSFSPIFLWQLGWWIIDFWTLVIWWEDLWGSPYCKTHPDKRNLCGCVCTWTGVMVTGNTLCSVTNPDFCCIVKMVVFECSDKLTRLYSMSVYCLEYRQAAELRYGVSSIAEVNPSSTFWIETWISTSTYVTWKPKRFHLLR